MAQKGERKHQALWDWLPGNWTQYSFREISQRFNVPERTIHRYAFQLGLQKNTPRNGEPYPMKFREKEYWYIACPDGKHRAVHRLRWEKENGPVPPGHVLICRNGDTLDASPANWELVTIAERARRFSYGNFEKGRATQRKRRERAVRWAEMGLKLPGYNKRINLERVRKQRIKDKKHALQKNVT